MHFITWLQFLFITFLLLWFAYCLPAIVTKKIAYVLNWAMCIWSIAVVLTLFWALFIHHESQARALSPVKVRVSTSTTAPVHRELPPRVVIICDAQGRCTV
jgi:hypothetical protein